MLIYHENSSVYGTPNRYDVSWDTCKRSIRYEPAEIVSFTRNVRMVSSVQTKKALPPGHFSGTWGECGCG